MGHYFLDTQYVQEILTQGNLNYLVLTHSYLCSKLIYKMGQDFLDI